MGRSSSGALGEPCQPAGAALESGSSAPTQPPRAPGAGPSGGGGWGPGAGAEDPFQGTPEGETEEAAADGGRGPSPESAESAPAPAIHSLPRPITGEARGPVKVREQRRPVGAPVGGPVLRSSCGQSRVGAVSLPTSGRLPPPRRASSRPPRPPLPGPDTPRGSQTSLWLLEVPKHHLSGCGHRGAGFGSPQPSAPDFGSRKADVPSLPCPACQGPDL